MSWYLMRATPMMSWWTLGMTIRPTIISPMMVGAAVP